MAVILDPEIEAEDKEDFFSAESPSHSEPKKASIAQSDHFLKNIFENIKKQKTTPKDFKNISLIRINYHNPELKKFFETEKQFIMMKPNGKFGVEIEAFEIPDRTPRRWILQLSLISLKTSNKVWEKSVETNLPIGASANAL